jgi:site-specific DNA recombinase
VAELIPALGVVRLSIERGNTTSPARQKEIITAAAAARGRKIVAWAEDLTVSAFKIHPLKRPDLKDKLAATSDQWDEIWFWRQDRFVRGPGDLSDMIRWCQEHGKGLISATENFDLNTPMGEAWAYMASIFAKMESVATSERVLGAHLFLRTNGRWGGGIPPYGYTASPNPEGKGWVLIIDDEAAAIIREAVRRIIGPRDAESLAAGVRGESVNAIATDFNQRGIISPQNHVRLRAGRELKTRKGEDTSARPWRATSLTLILRNPALLGYVTHGTEIVKRPNGNNALQRATVSGDDGTPIVRADPIISETDWDLLQERLNDLSQAQRRTRKFPPSMLLRVAYCACGSPMYRRLYTRHGHDYAYYKCHRSTKRESTTELCPTLPVNGPWLDKLAESLFLADVGHVEIMRREYRRGSNSADLVAMLRRSLDTARREYDSGGYSYPGGQQEYEERIKGLSDRLREAAGKAAIPYGYIDVPTGKTYRKMWLATPDPAARRQLMVGAGFRIEVAKTADSMNIMYFYDPGLAERAGRAANGQPVSLPPDEFLNFRQDASAIARAIIARSPRKGPRLITVGHDPEAVKQFSSRA